MTEEEEWELANEVLTKTTQRQSKTLTEENERRLEEIAKLAFPLPE